MSGPVLSSQCSKPHLVTISEASFSSVNPQPVTVDIKGIKHQFKYILTGKDPEEWFLWKDQVDLFIWHNSFHKALTDDTDPNTISVLLAIRASISEDVTLHIAGIKNAKDAFNKLEDRFSEANGGNPMALAPEPGPVAAA